jgi:hypothetical protein
MIVKMGIKVKKKTQKPKSPRGRRADLGIIGENKPGRPSEYYDNTPYLDDVSRLLSNRTSGALIYCYLIDSMLLQKWIISMVLFFLHRLNHIGPETLINSDRILFTPALHKMVEAEAEKLYQECRSLKDDELRGKAWKISGEIVRGYSLKEEIMYALFTYVCKLGASFYPHMVQTH